MVWRCSARRADEGSLPNRASSHNRLQFSVWDFAPSSPQENPFAHFSRLLKHQRGDRGGVRVVARGMCGRRL